MIEHSKPTMGRQEQKAISATMKTNYLAEGKIVSKFEKELAQYINSKGGVATCTGTLALHLALMCLDINSGDEIIIPSYACRSLLNSVLYSRAKPVLCDVSVEDYNMSSREAEKKITRRTKAIIIPHMYGCPAKIDEFKELGVYIIEDCAHSIGAEYKNRKVGSWGDLSIFSFEGTKYITTGEGGMVLSNSNYLLNRLKKLKEPDSSEFKIKYTYRMTNLQAAVGRVQLSRLGEFIRKRKLVANIYNMAFADCDMQLLKGCPESIDIYQRYMIRINKDIYSFMKKCYKKGVKVKQPVKPHPLHRYLNLSAKNFPNTEYIMRSAVSVPIYPLLTGKQIKHVVDTIKKVI